METYHQIGPWIAGIGLGIFALVGGLRSCNNYQIQNPNFTSNSRATGNDQFTNKAEYTRVKDGSEEMLIRDGKRIFRFQNFDGDDAIDRIRIDKYSTRDVFGLENILVRTSDYPTNKTDFDEADKLFSLSHNSKHLNTFSRL